MWADISKIIRETVRTLGQLIAGMFSSSERGKDIYLKFLIMSMWTQIVFPIPLERALGIINFTSNLLPFLITAVIPVIQV